MLFLVSFPARIRLLCLVKLSCSRITQPHTYLICLENSDSRLLKPKLHTVVHGQVFRSSDFAESDHLQRLVLSKILPTLHSCSSNLYVRFFRLRPPNLYAVLISWQILLTVDVWHGGEWGGSPPPLVPLSCTFGSSTAQLKRPPVKLLRCDRHVFLLVPFRHWRLLPQISVQQ